MRFFAVLLLIPLLSGCIGTNRSVNQFAEPATEAALNRALMGKVVIIRYTDGSEHRASDVSVIGDELIYSDTRTIGRSHRRPFRDVDMIYRRSHRKRLSGLAIGASPGVVYFASNPGSDWVDGMAHRVLARGVTLVGALAGVAVNINRETKYVLYSRDPGPSCRHPVDEDSAGCESFRPLPD